MLRLPFAILLSTTFSLAQSTGPFLATGLHGLIGNNTSGATGLLPPGQLFLKRAGFESLVAASTFAPTTPPAPPRPPLTRNAMFGPPATLPATFRLNAISSGLHTIFFSYNASGQPQLDLPAGHWGALVFSVSRTTAGTGVPAVAGESASPGGAGGDVFTWVLPGSTLPPLASCVTPGVVERALDCTEMGLLPTPQPELKDFDIFLPLYETEGTVLNLLPPEPWVYFTLPNAVAHDALLATWFTPGTESGATVLRTQWHDTGSGWAWSPPSVYVTFAQLGLTANDEIDALSVQEAGDKVLLSLVRTPTTTDDQQLMIASKVAGAWIQARPYVYDDTVDAILPIAIELGAQGGGDIDAMCEPDPSNANGVDRMAFATIFDCRSYLPFPATLSAAATAGAPTTAGTSTEKVSVANLPTAIPAIWVFALGLPGPGGSTSQDLLVLDAGVVTGPTLSHGWSFPAIPGAYGLSVDFQVVTLDASGLLRFSDVPRGHF